MLLTPANADEHPFAQAVCRVGQHDRGMQVASLARHPEEVSGVEIVEGGCNQTAPHLQRHPMSELRTFRTPLHDRQCSSHPHHSERRSAP